MPTSNRLGKLTIPITNIAHRFRSILGTWINALDGLCGDCAALILAAKSTGDLVYRRQKSHPRPAPHLWS